jgi:hypothetical protein
MPCPLGSARSVVLPKSLDDDFYTGRRSESLPFCVNDCVEVTGGPYRGRRGAVVVLDRSGNAPKFLVEFGDGTDELVAADLLKIVPEGTV